MKSLLLAVLLFSVVISAVDAQVAIGPEGSLLFSNYSIRSGGQSVSTTAVFGAGLGCIFSIPLTRDLNLQPAIDYVLNGLKYSVPYQTIVEKVNTLQVPIEVIYKFGKPNGDRLYLGLGPYMARNLSGSDNASGYGGGTTNLNIGTGDNDDLKPFDFGISADFGFQPSSGIFLHLHYQRGFTSLTPQGGTENTRFSTNYGVAIGYLFGNRQAAKTKKNAKDNTKDK
jgi:hypothetical protein